MKPFLPRLCWLALAWLALPAIGFAVDDLTVQNTTYTATQTVSADNSITATPAVVVASGANITFHAGARITLGAGFSVVSGGVFHASVGQSLAYTTGFESAENFNTGSVNGQRGWFVTQGSADVVTTTAYSGSRSLALQSGSTAAQAIQTFVASATSGVTYVDLYVLPVAATTAAGSSLVQTEATGVGFQIASGQGEIYTYDGVGANQWVATGRRFSLNASNQATAWLRLTLRLDYTAKTWDLYANGVLVDYDLAFSNNSETYFRQLTLRGVTAAAAYADGINAGATNPLFTDADKDGMDDAWETAHGLNPAVNDRNGDLDGDGLTNIQEYFLGTAPDSAGGSGADSDGNGLPDSWEVQYFGHIGVSPTADPDGDGLTNLQEYQTGRNPTYRADGLALPSGFQLILRTPANQHYGVNTSDWSISSVANP